MTSRKPSRPFLLLAFPFVLAGCKKPDLDISPMIFSECAGKSTVAHVEWRVPGTPVTPIGIYVAGVSHAPILWHSGGRIGKSDTGKWVFDGTTFSLRDGKGNLLARRTVTSVPCKS